MLLKFFYCSQHYLASRFSTDTCEEKWVTSIERENYTRQFSTCETRTLLWKVEKHWAVSLNSTFLLPPPPTHTDTHTFSVSLSLFLCFTYINKFSNENWMFSNSIQYHHLLQLLQTQQKDSNPINSPFSILICLCF